MGERMEGIECLKCCLWTMSHLSYRGLSALIDWEKEGFEIVELRGMAVRR